MNHNHRNHTAMISDFRLRFWVSFVLTAPVLLLSPMIQNLLLLDPLIGKSQDLYVLWILATIIFLYGGWPFLTGIFKELKLYRPGMMTLIALAISVAYFYSSAVIFGAPGKSFFWELATLIDVMLLGHWIEMKSVSGAGRALEKLAQLMPAFAHLIIGTGQTKEVKLAALKIGDIVLVKPGEKVPTDGLVVKGETEVNESMLTGESRLITKRDGDPVYGGAINGQGAIEVQINKTGKDTYLAQIIALIKTTQASHSHTQDLANRAALWLTYIAILAGGLTFTVWANAGADVGFAIERMVTVMVITCPHALGLAVPLVIAVSTSIAAQQGILIRNRTAFENASAIDTVVFDKTGTLTTGAFGVTDIVPLGKFSPDEILQWAASLESQSEHSIANGIVATAHQQNLQLKPVSAFKNLPGQGSTATIAKHEVKVVGPRYLATNHLELQNDEVLRITNEGKTVVYVVLDNLLIGAIGLSDIIRPESKASIQQLKDMDITCMMVTGDSPEVAKGVARKLKIVEYFASILPHQKVSIIKDIQSKRQHVAMVGDGINDAPALVEANLGIAIGAGTDIAIESADVVLVSNDPRDVVLVIDLAKNTYKKMRQNLIWATGYNIIAIPLAAGIAYPWGFLLSPALGAALMSLSTIIVAINALMLNSRNAPIG